MAKKLLITITANMKNGNPYVLIEKPEWAAETIYYTSPSEETVMITESSGNQYIWVFLPQKSEWELDLITQRAVLQKFDGEIANVLLSEEENIGRCHKAVVAMKYNNLFYDLSRKICNYIKTSA